MISWASRRVDYRMSSHKAATTGLIVIDTTGLYKDIKITLSDLKSKGTGVTVAELEACLDF